MQKQHVAVVSFLMTTCALSSFAMDRIDASASYTNKSLSQELIESIHEQQYELENFPKTHHELLHSSLQNIRANFSTIPDNYKLEMLKTMSTRLLLLTCVALYLPPEIVRNHFCIQMMDNETIAAEKFYLTPLCDHFELYFKIKTWLADDTIPVGPLYTATQLERNAILKITPSWYYEIPIMHHEIKKLYDTEISEELKQTYVQGKDVLVLPENRLCNCLGCTLSIVYGVCVFGCTLGIGAAIGSCAGCGPSLALHPAVLATASAGSSLSLCGGIASLCMDFQVSERVTL